MTDLDWLAKAISSWGAVDAQPMFGMQAYLVNGRMFAAAGERGLLVKLPAETRKQLLDSGQAQAAETAPGVAFGEWLTLPPPKIAEQEATLALVRQSFE